MKRPTPLAEGGASATPRVGRRTIPIEPFHVATRMTPGDSPNVSSCDSEIGQRGRTDRFQTVAAMPVPRNRTRKNPAPTAINPEQTRKMW